MTSNVQRPPIQTVGKKQGKSISTLLRFFGVKMKYKHRKAFMQCADLAVLYEDAKRNYREQMKAAHPDVGGTEEAAIAINKCWARLERWYKLNCPSVFYGLALFIFLIASVDAQAPVQPWIRRAYFSQNSIVVELIGPSLTDIVQINRTKDGYRDMRAFVNLTTLERYQHVGWPEIFRWRDTNDIVHGYTYRYRLRVVTGADIGPWSREAEAASEFVLPGSSTGDINHETNPH